MELKFVSAIVAHHRSRSGALQTGKSEEEITFRSVKVIAGSFLMLCLGLVIALGGPQFFHQEFVPTIGGFIFLVGIAIFIVASFHLAWTKAKPRRTPPVHEAVTQSDLVAPVAASLPGEIPSITESTTRLMDDVPSAPRPQQASGHQTE